MSNRTRFIILASLLVAGGVTIFWQEGNLQAVRAENLRLREQQATSNGASDAGTVAPSDAAVAEEMARLRDENRELFKLRNEVRVLKQQAKQLSIAQKENERLKSLPAAFPRDSETTPASKPVIVLNQLQFAGHATPEATMQTMLWALAQGDAANLAQCLMPETQEKAALRNPDELRKNAEEMMKQFKGLRVAARRVIADDQIELGLETVLHDNTEGEVHAVVWPFKRVGNDWKFTGPPP